jgi:hypothetical protein
MRTFLKSAGMNSDPAIAYSIYAVIIAVWLAALVFAVMLVRQEETAVEEPA